MSLVATRVKDLLLADAAVAAIAGSDGYVGRFPGLPKLPGFAIGEQSSSRNQFPLISAACEMEVYAADSVTGQALAEAIYAALEGNPQNMLATQSIWRTYGLIRIHIIDTSGPFHDEESPDWGGWVYYRITASAVYADPAA